MAKENIKKVIVTEKADKSKKTSARTDLPVELLFKRNNYIFTLIGILLVVIGFFLMAGGKMPSPDVWDENLIYNPVRIIVSPVVILSGLVLVLYAIFKK